MKAKRDFYFTNLVGQTFQDYTVIEFAERKGKDGKYNYVWLCQCVCGKRRKVSISNLRSSRTKGCGCKSYRGLDVTGETRGAYTAIEKAYKKGGRWYWKVQHQNGEFKYMSISNFKAKGEVKD